jgi:hypothetical protein
MKISFSLPVQKLEKLKKYAQSIIDPTSVAIIAIALSIAMTALAFMTDTIVSYGDAESHLNIAKRVIHSLTPGFAQLGGIWLPLPHLMMVPFVSIDSLWRTGLAGSIVSGFAFIVASVYLYKTTLLLTKNKIASFVAFIIFALNPNILYLQSTPMTELVLIMFFLLSSYYFIKYILNDSHILYLIFAAFFGFCASLSRYDGWFLVIFEAFGLILLYLKNLRSRQVFHELEGKLVLFCTLAFFGVAIWMTWDYLILGDPFYFTNSQFSAKTQQSNWLQRGELPSYHNIVQSFLYYAITAMSNAGVFLSLIAAGGFIAYLKDKKQLHRPLISMIFLIPLIFNVVTLYLGQSVIFIPHLTPRSFEWILFNVRYGAMFVPFIAFFFAFMWTKVPTKGKVFLILIILCQVLLYTIGYSTIVSRDDGTIGLSHAKRPDAEQWLARNYDDGLVLLDDFARTVSILRTNIPMQNVIYIGNKPYWEESLVKPEKYSKWIIMQKDDAVWSAMNDQPITQARLYKYFQKTYTSDEILIFKRNNVPAQD